MEYRVIDRNNWQRKEYFENQQIAIPVRAVNGRDERRTSAPPLTAPPGLALRLSRRASPKGACPPPLILGGAGGRIVSHGGIDFRQKRKSIPYCLGAFTLPGGGRNGSRFETHFDRNLHQIEGSFKYGRLWPETLAISRFL